MSKTLLILICAIQLCFAFQLPMLLGEGQLETDSIFQQNDFTVVVLWQTGCHECELALDGINNSSSHFEQLKVPVISINFNPTYDVSNALPIAKRSPYPVLYDAKARIAKDFGAATTDFYVVIMSRNGDRLWKLDESYPDAADKILNALKKLNIEPPKAQFLAKAQDNDIIALFDSGLKINGTAKVRGVHTVLTGASTGPYGEPIKSGNAYNFLFRPAVEYSPNNHLTVGTQFRITDASETVMRGAPDYFTNLIFSPYLNFSINSLSLTAGYFHENLSPLSIMRWDIDDNPPGAGGGQGGCRACAGLPGGLSFSNLEELSKDFGFEGFHLSFTPGDAEKSLNYRAFYARPTLESPICTYYPRHLLASSLSGKYTIANGFFIQPGIYVMNTQDEIQDCLNMPYIPVSEKALVIWQNSAAGEISVGNRYFKLSYEQLWSRTKKATAETIATSDVFDDRANMVTGEVNLKYENIFWNSKAAYYDIGDNCLSEYRALSYYTGTENFRCQMQTDYLLNFGSFGIIIFGKQTLFHHEAGKIESFGGGFDATPKIGGVRFLFSVSNAVEYTIGNMQDSLFQNTGTTLPEPFRRNITGLSFGVEPIQKLAITTGVNYIENKEGDSYSYSISRIYYIMTSANF